MSLDKTTPNDGKVRWNQKPDQLRIGNQNFIGCEEEIPAPAIPTKQPKSDKPIPKNAEKIVFTKKDNDDG
jgi:hypothetical protein